MPLADILDVIVRQLVALAGEVGIHLQPNARRIGLADRQASPARPELAVEATHPHICREPQAQSVIASARVVRAGSGAPWWTSQMVTSGRSGGGGGGGDDGASGGGAGGAGGWGGTGGGKGGDGGGEGGCGGEGG